METWINENIYHTISTDGEIHIHRFYMLNKDDICNECDEEIDICIIKEKSLNKKEALDKFKTLFIDMIDDWRRQI